MGANEADCSLLGDLLRKIPSPEHLRLKSIVSNAVNKNSRGNSFLQSRCRCKMNRLFALLRSITDEPIFYLIWIEIISYLFNFSKKCIDLRKVLPVISTFYDGVLPSLQYRENEKQLLKLSPGFRNFLKSDKCEYSSYFVFSKSSLMYLENLKLQYILPNITGIINVDIVAISDHFFF